MILGKQKNNKQSYIVLETYKRQGVQEIQVTDIHYFINYYIFLI